MNLAGPGSTKLSYGRLYNLVYAKLNRSLIDSTPQNKRQITIFNRKNPSEIPAADYVRTPCSGAVMS